VKALADLLAERSALEAAIKPARARGIEALRAAYAALSAFDGTHPEAFEAHQVELSAREEAEMGRKLRRASKLGLL
jgi:hypothetical protein